MSQGLRTRGSLINLDAAEGERKARIARDAMGDPFLHADDELLRAFREEEAAGARMLGAAVVVAVFVLGTALLLWAMPDIVAAIAGGPSIVVTVR